LNTPTIGYLVEDGFGAAVVDSGTGGSDAHAE